MKFVKGMMIGLGIGAGAAIMYSEGMMNKKVIMKKINVRTHLYS